MLTGWDVTVSRHKSQLVPNHLWFALGHFPTSRRTISKLGVTSPFGTNLSAHDSHHAPMMHILGLADADGDGIAEDDGLLAVKQN